MQRFEEMWRSYVTTVKAVCALVLALGLVYFLDQGSAPTSPRSARDEQGTDAGTAALSRTVRAREARALIERIGRDSRALMPEGFEGLRVGMPLEELRTARPNARLGRPSGRSAVWEETTNSGARVLYLASPELGVVTQVQFLSRLGSVSELLPHFQALRRRYGEPTGFWDCPEQRDASPMRRITWRADGASVMEAMLVHTGGVSVTLVVTATGDVPVALARSRCTPVTRETLAAWPIATELRGERIPFSNAR